MSAHAREVAIRYRRLPDREVTYRQFVLLERDDVVVTFQPSTELKAPVRALGRDVLEPGAAAVWFTFPGAWHDIGRFHLMDGTFTGLYANILTPVSVVADDGVLLQWDTTDLCLDVFQDAQGKVTLLDRPEFDHAEATGAMTPEWAARATEEADLLIRKIGEGTWPPPIVSEWPLERAIAALDDVTPEAR